MKRWLILFSVGCLVVALTGAANAAVEQGDTEVELLGGYLTESFDAGGSIDTWFISGAVGYFLTDNIQVGGVGAYMGVDTPGAGGNTNVYAVGAEGKLHFMTTNQLVPYLGGLIMWATVDPPSGSNVDGILYGPLAGLRYELNAYNDFYVEAQYHLWGGDADDGLDDGFGLFFGIVHQFK